MPLTPIDEALATVLEAFHPLAPIRLPLEDALHRYAAEPLAARADVPGFDHSAMDGYAVRASDLTDATAERPAALAVTGESRAGGAPPPAVALGQAVRIFTGAPVPEGADTVVMQEDTDQGRRVVHITRHPGSGSNIRRRGEDLRAGAPLLEASQRLGAGEIGLLASQGIAAVRVHRRPQVAILSTGDELRDVSGPLEPGTIVDSNSYALSAQVTEAGGEPQVLARAGDRVDVLSERVRQGLRADVLLTVGGVSVGDYDLVHDALRQA
jgi:molybdopterin molybdotransferase